MLLIIYKKKSFTIISMNKNCLYIALFLIIFACLVAFFPKEVSKSTVEAVSNTIETVKNTTESGLSQAGGNMSNELKNILECSKILDTII